MKNGSEGEWLKCPYCEEEFFTSRPDRQFCSPTHRKEHWREKKSQQQEEGVWSVDLSSDEFSPEAEEEKAPVKRYGDWKARGRKCEVCDFRGSNLLKMRVTQHHIIPRSLGGKADPDNLVDLCDACHDWAEMFADYAKSRSEFMHIVQTSYPWPEEMNQPKYDADKVHCRLHGDWRVWVFGGVPAPPWGCSCKKSENENAITAGNGSQPQSGTSDSAQADVDTKRGATGSR